MMVTQKFYLPLRFNGNTMDVEKRSVDINMEPNPGVVEATTGTEKPIGPVEVTMDVKRYVDAMEPNIGAGKLLFSLC